MSVSNCSYREDVPTLGGINQFLGGLKFAATSQSVYAWEGAGARRPMAARVSEDPCVRRCLCMFDLALNAFVHPGKEHLCADVHPARHHRFADIVSQVSR